MSNNKTTIIFGTLSLIVLLLAACGGGPSLLGTGKAWGTAALIETDNTGDAQVPQIAFDQHGDAISVWQQFIGGRNKIMSNYAASGVWGTSAPLESGTYDAASPQIAIDANDNAMAVWYQSDGIRNNIMANHYNAVTNSWAGAVTVSNGLDIAINPHIAFDASGNAIAVWQQWDSVNFVNNIWSNRYTAGVGWGTAAVLDADATAAHNAYDTDIAIDASGNAMVVWYRSDGTRNNIWASFYNVGTHTWGTATLIENDTGDTNSPHVAFDASGNALAVWQQWDGSRYNTWYNRYDVSLGWGAAGVPIGPTTGTGSQLNPQLAIDSNGNALAVWQQSDGQYDYIWANRYNAGTLSWGTPAAIETGNTGDAGNAQIAFDPSGNALAVWQQTYGTYSQITANRYTAGNGWGTAAPIESGNTGDATVPQIAFDTYGNAIAVWQQQFNGTRYDIWASRYQ